MPALSCGAGARRGVVYLKRIAIAAAAASLELGAAFAVSAQTAEASPAPAVAPTPASPSQGDPWEGFNRFSYRVFMVLDRAVVRPVARAYLKVVPAPVRGGVRNVLTNMGEPVVALNDAFQGHGVRAGETAVRFATNTTLGVGGLWDVAARHGLAHHDNGFDLTLGRYKVRPGPYLFLPILGPSTLRDFVGYCIDGTIDPLHWAKYPYRTAISLGHSVVGGIDLRARNDAQFEALISDATDPYATLRSVYLQNEQSQVDAGKPDAEPPLPDFEDDTPAKPGATDAPAKPTPPPAAEAPAATDSAQPAPAPEPAAPEPAPTAPAPAAQ